MKITISNRIEDPTINLLGDLFRKSNGDRNPGGGCAFILESFRHIYRQSLIDLKGIFDHDELIVMVHALEKSPLSAEFSGQRLISNIADNLKMSDGDTDLICILDELKRMPAAQLYFLEVWIHGYWSQSSDEFSIGMAEYIKPLL